MSARTDDSPLSPREVSDHLKKRGFPCSPRTVDRMIKRFELEAFVTSGGWQRLRKSECERWIKAHS